MITVRKLLRDTEIESALQNILLSELNAKYVTKAACQSDQLALRAFEYTVRILGLKLADMVDCMDSEAIIISRWQVQGLLSWNRLKRT